MGARDKINAISLNVKINKRKSVYICGHKLPINVQCLTLYTHDNNDDDDDTKNNVYSVANIPELILKHTFEVRAISTFGIDYLCT